MLHSCLVKQLDLSQLKITMQQLKKAIRFGSTLLFIIYISAVWMTISFNELNCDDHDNIIINTKRYMNKAATLDFRDSIPIEDC